MEIRAEDIYGVTCEGCGKDTSTDAFIFRINYQRIPLCFSCVLKLRDLAHEATCEKDVTGKCDCWGER